MPPLETTIAPKWSPGMVRACLVVHRVSHTYVRNVVLFIHQMLKDQYSETTRLFVCDQIGDAAHDDGTLVFVIGEYFGPHIRRPGCRYVFLNFSIVEMLGNPLTASYSGWVNIRRKKRMLLEKLDRYDALLDYFPPQTRMLGRQCNLPVLNFVPGVHPQDLPGRTGADVFDYDVCFVGGITPRRRLIIDRLVEMGLQVSPHDGVIFEEMAARSRCCLNMHSQRSNHLETPRIIGALAVGTPVVSEKCYGLETLISPDMIVTAPVQDLAARIRDLLLDRGRLLDRRQKSCGWFDDFHFPRSKANWRGLCSKLAKLPAASPSAAVN